MGAEEEEKPLSGALKKAKELGKQHISNEKELKTKDKYFKEDSSLLKKLLRSNPWYMLKQKKRKGKQK